MRSILTELTAFANGDVSCFDSTAALLLSQRGPAVIGHCFAVRARHPNYDELAVSGVRLEYQESGLMHCNGCSGVIVVCPHIGTTDSQAILCNQSLKVQVLYESKYGGMHDPECTGYMRSRAMHASCGACAPSPAPVQLGSAAPPPTADRVPRSAA